MIDRIFCINLWIIVRMVEMSMMIRSSLFSSVIGMFVNIFLLCVWLCRLFVLSGFDYVLVVVVVLVFVESLVMKFLSFGSLVVLKFELVLFLRLFFG